MTFQVTFKTPDALDDAIRERIEHMSDQDEAQAAGEDM